MSPKGFFSIDLDFIKHERHGSFYVLLQLSLQLYYDKIWKYLRGMNTLPVTVSEEEFCREVRK